MKKLKQRYNYVKEKIKKDTFDLDEEGREIVDLTIIDSDKLISDYHPDGKAVIDNEMAKVISDAIKPTSTKRDLLLRIKCEKYTPDKETEYKQAITNYYINEFADKERKLHNNTIITITLLIAAIISFGILFVMNLTNLPWILVEMVDIVAWVFAWEVVDMIFFQRQLIKFEQRQDLKVIFAKIIFSTYEGKKKETTDQ